MLHPITFLHFYREQSVFQNNNIKREYIFISFSYLKFITFTFITYIYHIYFILFVRSIVISSNASNSELTIFIATA